ncbi:MAG: (2Fe-2S)-binding protein [Coriobacteriales bacterium]|jgi:predicted molibdopterin-dependent oxidoreductase YjgC|nr:(2Fe-2S)-binding protein [Coriobacteriales bacterium]
MPGLTVKIDGCAVNAQKGDNLAELIVENGFELPLLCGANPALRGQACCHLCSVRIHSRGRSKVVAACAYSLDEDCSVETRPPDIEDWRGLLLALMLRRAPDSQTLQNLAKGYDLPQLPPLKKETVAPYKVCPSSACVNCGSCLRSCALIGPGALKAAGLGPKRHIEMASPKACIGCASCAALCPTGAISCEDDLKAGKRLIWGQEFELARCETCGEILGAEQALAYAAAKAEPEGLSEQQAQINVPARDVALDIPRLCPRHRQEQLAREHLESSKSIGDTLNGLTPYRGHSK